MSYSITEVEGIGPAFQKKLTAAGIASTAALLKQGGSKSGRAALAAATGIDEKRILSWVNLADLMRVKGIGTQFAELLHAAGVDTVKELRTRSAANLARVLADTNASKKLTRTVPAESQVAAFIASAKQTEPAVTY